MKIVLPAMLSQESLHATVAAAQMTTGATVDAALHLDLSAVEFADFGALAQLLLLADAAARSAYSIRVDLPLPRIHEDAMLTPEAIAAATRRAGCLRFLQATGFISAGRLPHLPEADVDMRIPPDPSHILYRPIADLMSKPIAAAARILTFRWLGPDSGEQLWRSDGLVAVIRGLRSIGLSNRDAQLLANAVIFELVENVAVHARDNRADPQPHALVGAIANVPSRPPPDESLPAHLRAFTDGYAPAVTIRVVVGDSGIGLVRHLAPHAPAELPGVPNLPDGDDDRPWDRPEKIVLWSMERWSTSTAAGSSAKGTRGLWRAQRAVRSFGAGTIAIHTADASAGYLFMGSTYPVRMLDASGIPGTFCDIRVVPDRVPVTGGFVAVRATQPSTRPADARNWQWVRVAEQAGGEPSLERAEELVRSGVNVLLTVDGGRTHHIAHERLVNVLSRASELANPAVVAVLLTGIDPVAVEAGIDAIHNPPPTSPRGVGEPFLLIEGNGAARWCGGPSWVRTVLNDLSSHSVPLDAGAEPSPGRRVLQDQPHLVERDGDAIRLLVHAQDIVGMLHESASRALSAAATDGPGVSRGSFRTPNLQLTDRWVDADRVVHEAMGPGIAAFLLAQKIAHEELDPARGETRIVLVSDVIQGLAHLLAECAQIRSAVVPLASEAAKPVISEPLPPRTQVVLLADILMTENDAKRVAREVMGWHAVPILLAVPLDARDEEGPVKVDGVQIPVVSLAHVPVDPDAIDLENVTDIDPIFRTPAPSSQSDSLNQYHWTREEFLAGCRDLPWIIGLGHLVRPAGRHFTAYFDASRLLDPSSRLRESVAEGMVDVVADWIKQDADAAGPIVFCFAGSKEGYARGLAGLLSRRVEGRLGVTTAVVPIPRSVVGNRYAFPESVELPTGAGVVVVDWGSFDATTVLQMIRLAAEGGARRIFGSVLLSQLSEHDERTLTMLNSVAGGTPDAPPVPVAVQFFSVVGITPLPRSDCTLCRLAAGWEGDAAAGGLPGTLAAHAAKLAAALAPLGREQSAERIVDAFGAPCTTQDAIEYVRLRALLIAAIRSTGAAAAMADEISQLKDRPLGATAAALVRLLTAEQHWLGLRPVRLAHCRAEIQTLAARVATDEQLAERLRLQAIILLARLAPEALARNLTAIWRSAVHSEELLLHIVYELWSLVRSGYPQIDLADLRARLAGCLDVGRSEYAGLTAADEMQYLLTRLISDLDWSHLLQEDLTPLAAWGRLRTHYLDQLAHHCDAETEIINLRIFLGEPPPVTAEPLDDDLWNTIYSSWSTVAEFLKERVLPYTIALADVLSGPFARERLSRQQLAGLERLTAPVALTQVDVLEAKVRQLRHGTPSDPDIQAAWQDVSHALDEWHQVVLSSGGDRLIRADLAQFLDACPAPLMATVKECIELGVKQALELDVTLVAPDQPEREVFIHRSLLRNAIQQVFNNAVKPTHRRPEFRQQPVDMQIEVAQTDGVVRMAFRNKGTMPSLDGHGHGIVSMNRKLQAFQASLEPAPPDGDWTFEIHLNLVQWSNMEGE